MKTRTVAIILILVVVITSPLFADGILGVKPANAHREIQLPLTGIDVQIDIIDQVAITTIRNDFFNEEDHDFDGTFYYRVPPNASVTDFGFWRGDSLILLELRPGAQGGHGGGGGDVDRRLRAFLGPNPFRAPLYSIPPGIFSVFIRYVELLPYDFGEVQMQYPLYCGDYLVAPIESVFINVNIEAQREITDLSVNCYEDNTEITSEDDFHATINLSGEQFSPEEDWCVNIVYNQEDIGAWLYAHRSDPEQPGYFMLVIDPGIVDINEAVPKYFTFVLDHSGSMFGHKLEQACQAIQNCFDHLLPIDFFNIIKFSTEVEMYNQEMLQANEGNLADACEYIDQIRATQSTNIYGALMTAITQEMGENAANQVIFTTDGLPTAGEITDPDQIIRNVAENNNFDARIFSIGIGNDVDDAFLIGLSEVNRGISVMVDPDEERIDEVISDFYQYFASPSLVDPVVEISEGIQIDSLYPLQLQDVAAGKQLYMYGRYNTFGEGDITLSGIGPNGDLVLNFENIEFPEETASNEFVPRMWAKSIIDYWIRWMDINGERQDIIDMIVELSLEYGILTPYTEFDPEVGVDEIQIVSFNSTNTEKGLKLEWVSLGTESTTLYNVYRSFNSNGPFLKINDQPLTNTSYIDAGVNGDIVAYYRVEILLDGESRMTEVFCVGEEAISLSFDSIYPNPFNDFSWISFTVPKSDLTRLKLYNLKGQMVRSLLNESMNAGVHHIAVDARGLPSGIYLLQLISGEHEAKAKLMVTK